MVLILQTPKIVQACYVSLVDVDMDTRQHWEALYLTEWSFKPDGAHTRFCSFPKLGIPFLMVPKIGIIVFWGLYLGKLPFCRHEKSPFSDTCPFNAQEFRRCSHQGRAKRARTASRRLTSTWAVLAQPLGISKVLWWCRLQIAVARVPKVCEKCRGLAILTRSTA